MLAASGWRIKWRAVAQLGRALRSGRRGRGFKSHQPDCSRERQRRFGRKRAASIVNQTEFSAIALTGFTVAFFHVAMPTHWVPFVLTARVALCGRGPDNYLQHIRRTTSR
jgi:hypothetical protein